MKDKQCHGCIYRNMRNLDNKINDGYILIKEVTDFGKWEHILCIDCYYKENQNEILPSELSGVVDVEIINEI